MMVVREDYGPNPPGAAGDDSIGQWNNLALAIQVPKRFFHVGPKPIVRWDIEHNIPKGTKFLADSRRAQRPSNLTANDATDGEVANLGRHGETPQGVATCAQ
jgi:hypothetical protein